MPAIWPTIYKSVTHVPGQFCYLCTRFKPSSSIDWSSSENPYSAVFSGSMSTNGRTKGFDELQGCIKKDEQNPPEKVCFANVKALTEALSKPLPPRPSLSELNAAVSRLAALMPSSSSNLATSASPAEAQNAAKALAQKRKVLLDKVADCTKLTKESGYKFQELVKFLSSLENVSPTAQVWQSPGNLDQIADECRLMLRVIHNEETTGTTVSTNTCPIVINGPFGGASQSYVTMSVFKALLRTKEDMEAQMDTFLKSNGSWLFSSNGSSSSPGDSDPAACKYNPVKTAEWIESLLKNDCIARVYVPDPWLVQRLESFGSKIILGQMPEPDRMMAEIGGLDCQETTK